MDFILDPLAHPFEAEISVFFFNFCFVFFLLSRCVLLFQVNTIFRIANIAKFIKQGYPATFSTCMLSFITAVIHIVPHHHAHGHNELPNPR